MIGYFDTSAVIPLIIEEPTSARCTRLWSASERVVSVTLMYAEARAALAMARRTGRLNSDELAAAVDQLENLIGAFDRVQVTESLVRRAGDLAQEHSLRGYDAVHLAAAMSVAGADGVFISNDRILNDAAVAVELNTVAP
ncbi:MAG: type II toxin-antitoxin system VapC family toxin [Actinobacteria bacterium]|nr:type II toxin-antitoxin system VapC family toxin [Actinomycetota bacterium]